MLIPCFYARVNVVIILALGVEVQNYCRMQCASLFLEQRNVGKKKEFFACDFYVAVSVESRHVGISDIWKKKEKKKTALAHVATAKDEKYFRAVYRVRSHGRSFDNL